MGNIGKGGFELTTDFAVIFGGFFERDCNLIKFIRKQRELILTIRFNAQVINVIIELLDICDKVANLTALTPIVIIKIKRKSATDADNRKQPNN